MAYLSECSFPSVFSAMASPVVCALLALAATGYAPAAAPVPSPDARFDAFKRQFLLALWRQQKLATTKGYHTYDSLLMIPDAAQRQRDAAFANTQLGTFDRARLSPANQIDLRLPRNELRVRPWPTRCNSRV